MSREIRRGVPWTRISATGPSFSPLRRAQASRLKSQASAFTLIEMMVVIVIVGMMYAIVFNSLDFLNPHYRLSGAARKIAGLFKVARSTAAGGGVDCWIQYDLAAPPTCVLYAPETPEPGSTLPDGTVVPEETASPTDGSAVHPQLEPSGPRESLGEDVTIVSVYIGARQQIQSGRANVRVSPFGISANHIVNLQNEDGEKLGIRFNGLTGHVTFSDDFIEPQPMEEDR